MGRSVSLPGGFRGLDWCTTSYGSRWMGSTPTTHDASKRYEIANQTRGSAARFRPDQVEHVVTTFPQQDDAPSFADHAPRLLELHGDAGSAGGCGALPSFC